MACGLHPEQEATTENLPHGQHSHPTDCQTGGVLGRKGDDEPGAKTLWLGMRKNIAVFVRGTRCARELELAG